MNDPGFAIPVDGWVPQAATHAALLAGANIVSPHLPARSRLLVNQGDAQSVGRRCGGGFETGRAGADYD